MVTFINGDPEKKLYRHFKIYQQKGNDDISSLKEVAKRRKKHLKDWGKPDLIIVDGGKGQVAAFKQIFQDTGIPVIGLAKKEETLVIPSDSSYILVKLKRGPEKNLVQRLRNEAHRFARRYHHYLIRKDIYKQ
jgi:excinuclease ABC subunit C